MPALVVPQQRPTPTRRNATRYVMPAASCRAAASASDSAAAAAARPRLAVVVPQPPQGNSGSSNQQLPSCYPRLFTTGATNSHPSNIASSNTSYPSSGSPDTAFASSNNSSTTTSRQVRIRSDIYTSWHTRLPDGRVEINARASQARVYYPLPRPTSLAETTASTESRRQAFSSRHGLPTAANNTANNASGAVNNQQSTDERRPLPATTTTTMVHETRHHDYDHDVDLDYKPSDSEEEPQSPVTSAPASPSTASAAAAAAAKSMSPPPPRKRRSTGAGSTITPSKKSPQQSKSPKQPQQQQQQKKKQQQQQQRSHSSIPSFLRFPVLLLSSYFLSMLLYSSLMQLTAYDLATVSRSAGSWSEIGALASFKAVELAIGWWGQYDGYDLAALTLLTHTPYLFLLTAFYSIKPSTLVVSLLIDVSSVLIPTQLLRPLSAAHDPDAPARRIANRSIISDLPVQVYTSAFGSAVYALVLSLSFHLGMPAYLVSRFDSLTSMTLAHSPYVLPQLMLAFLPLGFAAKIFLFTPSTSAKRDGKDAKVERFNPETASLGETVLYNVWGFKKRTRVAIVRSSLLVALTVVNTFVQVVAHVAGTEPWGAAVWSATWGAAAASTGYMLWWVANVSEVRSI